VISKLAPCRRNSPGIT